VFSVKVHFLHAHVNVPIEHVPIEHVPIEHVPVQHVPIEHLPVQHVPLEHLPVQHVPIEHVSVQHVGSTRANPQGTPPHVCSLAAVGKLIGNFVGDWFVGLLVC
jgi:hypothetical protein